MSLKNVLKKKKTKRKGRCMYKIKKNKYTEE